MGHGHSTRSLHATGGTKHARLDDNHILKGVKQVAKQKLLRARQMLRNVAISHTMSAATKRAIMVYLLKMKPRESLGPVMPKAVLRTIVEGRNFKEAHPEIIKSIQDYQAAREVVRELERLQQTVRFE